MGGFAEDSTDFEVLLDEIGDGSLQSARIHVETKTADADKGQFAGEIAPGIDAELFKDDTRTIFVLVFAEASDVETANIAD